LIIDLRLGRDELHGWDVLHEIRRDPQLSDLPTIICSGDIEGLASLDGKLDEFRRVATIRKPFAVADMLSTLEHVLDREPA
jgi:CheY-like chemotaxis protein